MGTLDCFATLAMTDKMDCRVALAMTGELIATIFLRKLLGGATFNYALFDNKTNCIIIKKRMTKESLVRMLNQSIQNSRGERAERPKIFSKNLICCCLQKRAHILLSIRTPVPAPLYSQCG